MNLLMTEYWNGEWVLRIKQEGEFVRVACYLFYESARNFYPIARGSIIEEAVSNLKGKIAVVGTGEKIATFPAVREGEVEQYDRDLGIVLGEAWFLADRDDLGERLRFEEVHHSHHLDVSRILLDGVLVGTERVSYPKSKESPFAPPEYKFLRLDLVRKHTAVPIGTAPLVLMPEESEDGIGFMMAGWNDIGDFVGSFRDFRWRGKRDSDKLLGKKEEWE